MSNSYNLNDLIRQLGHRIQLQQTGHVPIPRVGLGTYQMHEETIRIAIPAALDIGYRLIDTAACYRNEQYIGNAVRKYLQEQGRKCDGVSRSDLFIESKLHPKEQGYERAKKAIEDSLSKLNLEYIDLYLIHWPGTAGLHVDDPKNKLNRAGSWKALEEAKQKGYLKSIGVSNYSIRHLEEMKDYATIFPVLNQIELHPAYYPSELIEYCRSNGIFVQAYSSLGRGHLLQEDFLSKHSLINELALKYNVSVGQIFLRWAIQHNFGILPKSNSVSRIYENASLFHFELTADELYYLDRISRISESSKICWDPEPVN